MSAAARSSYRQMMSLVAKRTRNACSVGLLQFDRQIVSAPDRASRSLSANRSRLRRRASVIEAIDMICRLTPSSFLSSSAMPYHGFDSCFQKHGKKQNPRGLSSHRLRLLVCRSSSGRASRRGVRVVCCMSVPACLYCYERHRQQQQWQPLWRSRWSEDDDDRLVSSASASRQAGCLLAATFLAVLFRGTSCKPNLFRRTPVLL